MENRCCKHGDHGGGNRNWHAIGGQAMGLMMRMADDNRYFDICISSGLAGALQAGFSAR